MNYIRIYTNLIQKYGKSTKPSDEYYERHHIVPVCIGGTDDAENLTYLSARCHLLAHWLLCRIYPKKIKLAHAFFMMCTMKNSKMYRVIPNIKILAEARRRKSELLSKRLKNKSIEFNTPDAIQNRIASAIKNGSYRGLNNGRSKAVDVYNYFTGELVASQVSVTEWGRANGVERNLNLTLYADRTKKSCSKNRHHAKGYYIVPHGNSPYPPAGGEYLGPYSNQGHIGLKKGKNNECKID